MLVNGVEVVPYLDPASMIFPEGFFPILGVFRRDHTLERDFVRGIYDSAINKKQGEYTWMPPKHIPPAWEFTIKDVPCNPLINATLNPVKCLEQTDAYLEQYAGLPQSLPVVQFLFGDARSLESRLKVFKDRWGFIRYGIGNLKGLKHKAKVHAIGDVILRLCLPPDRPHIFGCPTELLRYLLKHGKRDGFQFSLDNNNYWRDNERMASGKAERVQFMLRYYIKLGFFPELRKRKDRSVLDWIKGKR
jgi:hypothetical protein